jgi:hypothetical protein
MRWRRRLRRSIAFAVIDTAVSAGQQTPNNLTTLGGKPLFTGHKS